MLTRSWEGCILYDLPGTDSTAASRTQRFQCALVDVKAVVESLGQFVNKVFAIVSVYLTSKLRQQ